MHSSKTFGIQLNIQHLPNNVDKIELLNVEVAIQGADIHLMLIEQK